MVCYVYKNNQTNRKEVNAGQIIQIEKIQISETHTQKSKLYQDTIVPFDDPTQSTVDIIGTRDSNSLSDCHFVEKGQHKFSGFFVLCFFYSS